MTIDRSELQDNARKAFGEAGLVPDADASWANLTEMGWFMMTVAEEQGGLGMGREAAGVIHYELGRALVPGAAIAQMLVIEALAATGQDELLERAMGGEVMTTDLCHALDADKASHILLVSEDRIVLAPIASATHRVSWDETRRLFDVATGDEVILAKGADAAALANRLRSQLLLMSAADSIGGAEAALSMTIDYLKTRRQFDRPLAMFQALKHRVADLKIAHKAAEALFWDRATGEPGLAQMGALKAHCTKAYATIAEEAIQLHGGIGLTQEHPCHLFLKRALLNCALGGDADYWEEMAGRKLISATS
jgi:alkylation response protein AidB-like acyl-CoA dehydrogenase